MSDKMVTVSKNFNNYKSEAINTKIVFLSIFIRNITTLTPLPSCFFLCLEKFKNLRNVIPYQAVLLSSIVEDN